MTNALGSTHAPEYRYASAEIDTLNVKWQFGLPMKKKYDRFFNKRYLFISLFMLVLAAGFGAGWFSGIAWFKNGEAGPVREMRLAGYNFINPLLECDTAKDVRGQGAPAVPS